MVSKAKSVIVTGGGDGIGRAIAEAFIDTGAEVYICDIQADRVAQMNRPEQRLHAIQCDVSNEIGVDHLFDQALNHFGGQLDVLVNNVGISGPTGPIEAMSLTDWKDTFEVNVHGAFLCLRRAVPVMKQAKSGSIINISSTAGLIGYPLRTPYAAAKWGLIGLTKSLAMELGPFGIRVNAICPGSVEGPRMDRVIAKEAEVLGVDESEVRKGYIRQVSMRTFIEAKDIADTVLFLCSDKAAKISGQALSVDGHTETLAPVEF
jgi:NAD(P)-dependent dehydrogenase (short-subunit alcohol dehydrogenase family)